MQTVNEKKIIVFTHNDLDAFGSLAVIKEKFKGYEFEVHHTNYSNIPEKVDVICNSVMNEKPAMFICADVSFSTSEPEFVRLTEFMLTQDIHFWFFDHHLYSDGFFDSISERNPKFKYWWDKTKCATKICYDVLLSKDPKTPTLENLERLVQYIDVYNIWQWKDSKFQASQFLNEYFWAKVNVQGDNGIELLAEEFRQDDYNIPSDFQPIVQKIKSDQDAHLVKVEESGLVFRNTEHKTTLYFSEEHFNPFMIKEHLAGQWYVIQIYTWGLIKVRISQDCDLTDEQFNQIRLEMTGTTDIGHKNAFTWKSKADFSAGSDAPFTEAERLCNILLKYTSS